MAKWEDTIKLSVSIDCNSDDRSVIAEAIEGAVADLVASWEDGSVGEHEVRVVG